MPRQRCWAHKLRNVAARLPRKHQEASLGEAKEIYQAPKAVACLEADLEELVPFLACPPAYWKKVRTTNAIERAFREVRYRTRPMSCF